MTKYYRSRLWRKLYASIMNQSEHASQLFSEQFNSMHPPHAVAHLLLN